MTNPRFILIAGFLICFSVSSSSTKAQTRFLDQNWDDSTRQLFYTTTQGSRLIPYEWFLALETAEGSDSFVRTRLPQLGYLENNNLLANPDKLPVGFVMDQDFEGRRFLGLNCAACHTNQIRYKGTTFQVDGAPTLADMWGLLSGLNNSLDATATNEAKFARFASKILGNSAPAHDISDLKNDVNDFRGSFAKFVASSNPDHTGKLTWGRARLDAFGMIFNRVTSIDLDIPANAAAPDAPVSYPFLWGTSFEDRVQWNASAPNHNDIERLGRNVGEVLGVFAQTDLQKASFLRPYYRTSARRLNQVLMENWLKRLWSPEWPKELPPIHAPKRNAGEVLFKKHCISCHKVVPHKEQSTPITVTKTPVGEVGTDNRMALNAIVRRAKTGRLSGSALPPTFEPLPDEMPTGALLLNVVQGAVISPFHDVGFDALSPFRSLRARIFDLHSGRGELEVGEITEFMKQATIDNESQLRRFVLEYKQFIDDYDRKTQAFVDKLKGQKAESIQMEDNPYVYKARPLDGIWATAPYLHNGSVPNLYELLLPADQRTKVFHVGNTEFDPEKVGFRLEPGATTTEFDTSIPGNRNTGHDQYGNKDFSESDRLNLLEYLKSL